MHNNHLALLKAKVIIQGQVGKKLNSFKGEKPLSQEKNLC